MHFALAAALAAAALAVAAPALNPHHAGLAERSHAAAMWNRAYADTRDAPADLAPAADSSPTE